MDQAEHSTERRPAPPGANLGARGFPMTGLSKGRAGSPALRARGAGLIEVLICMVLLSVGVLSMSWLQAAAVRHDKLTQFRGTATHIAGGLADRMRANAAAASSYARLQTYAPATASTYEKDCATLTCSAQELATYDLAVMRNLSRSLLPDGDLQVDVPSGGASTIWVLWRDPAITAATNDSTTTVQPCPAGIGTPDPMPQCLPIRVLL